MNNTCKLNNCHVHFGSIKGGVLSSTKEENEKKHTKAQHTLKSDQRVISVPVVLEVTDRAVVKTPLIAGGLKRKDSSALKSPKKCSGRTIEPLCGVQTPSQWAS